MPDNLKWVVIKSAHIVSHFSRVPGRLVTRCGRIVENADVLEGMPEGKTCENCFRLNAKDVERAAR